MKSENAQCIFLVDNVVWFSNDMEDSIFLKGQTRLSFANSHKNSHRHQERLSNHLLPVSKMLGEKIKFFIWTTP